MGARQLLHQRFTAQTPERVRLADIVYIRMEEGWLYLPGIKNLSACAIVGSAMAERMACLLTRAALEKAWH